jgi:hypothetical protein
MRSLATSLALAALASLGLCAWGCTTLGGDCDLNLNCPGTIPIMCTGVLLPADACTRCAEANCCKEVADCNADPSMAPCLGCYYSLWPPAPPCVNTPSAALLTTLTKCMSTSCSPACNPADVCNPVNGQGCGGDPCDAAFPGAFLCGPPGPGVAICGMCDYFNGPYCAPGLHCHTASHTCARFCCDSTDCGMGQCVTDPTMAFGQLLPYSKAKVGICLNQAGTSAECSAPPTPTSKGACAPSFP